MIRTEVTIFDGDGGAVVSEEETVSIYRFDIFWNDRGQHVRVCMSRKAALQLVDELSGVLGNV